MSQTSGKRTLAKSLSETQIGEKITFAGWIVDVSHIGRLGFLKMRDMSGLAQGIATGTILDKIKEIPRQSSVLVSGIVSKTKAKNLPVEIDIKEITVTGRAIQPLPIDPTGRIESSLDKRLDCRALDLRNENVSSIFKIRSEALHVIRSILRSKMFTEVQTPKIIGSATEGGANLFGFEYFNKRAFLAQSPQLYKEELTLGLERIYEIGPYFRAESSHTVRHLSEFISIDLEAAYLDYVDIIDLVEELVLLTLTELSTMFPGKVIDFGELEKKGIPAKIPRLTYENCIQELRDSGERIKIGEDLSDAALRKLGELHEGLYFIIDWPSTLKPFYIMEHESKKHLSKSFDLQYGYLELVSGGSREHNHEKLKSKMTEQGLDPKSFSYHLRTFDWGMPPHSGCGIGLDRLMMMLTSTDNIREVVLYPRDTDRLTP
ncbi:MAG TPA: aspartate--tRNA(Asn) ligase [Nitrososphaeraceae archaeon]|jgi:aspartyl-tRNA synthetase